MSVILYGKLKELESNPIELIVDDANEAIKGLNCMFGDKFRDLFLATEHTVIVYEDNYHVVPIIEGEEIFSTIGAIIGSAVSGTLSTGFSLAGGLSFTVAGATAPILTISTTSLVFGAALVASTIISLTNAPDLNYKSAEVDRAPSFLYNGVVNVVEQGGAIPIIYGKHMAGSTVISANLVTEELGMINNELPPAVANLWQDTNQWIPTNVTLLYANGYIDVTKTTDDVSILISNIVADISSVIKDNTKYRVTAFVETFSEFIIRTTYQAPVTLSITEGTYTHGTAYTGSNPNDKVIALVVEFTTGVVGNPINITLAHNNNTRLNMKFRLRSIELLEKA